MDSTQETLNHRERVGYWIKKYIILVKEYAGMGFPQFFIFETGMLTRARVHDESKLHPPEKQAFDECTQQLKNVEYDSPEYRKTLSDLHEAIYHHYAHNRHHPEFFNNVFGGMEHEDLAEMLCDWIAATERHTNGDVFDSLAKNKERFNYPEGLNIALWNTAILLKGKSLYTGNPMLWNYK
jgi:hypothetical protein